MKILFRGWKREVHQHEHEVVPVRLEQETYYPGKSGDPINWSTSVRATGKMKDLALSGDFLVEFTFTPEELRNWLKQYVASEPEAAARILAEMQGEAAISLAEKAKWDAVAEAISHSSLLGKK